MTIPSLVQFGCIAFLYSLAIFIALKLFRPFLIRAKRLDYIHTNYPTLVSERLIGRLHRLARVFNATEPQILKSLAPLLAYNEMQAKAISAKLELMTFDQGSPSVTKCEELAKKVCKSEVIGENSDPLKEKFALVMRDIEAEWLRDSPELFCALTPVPDIIRQFYRINTKGKVRGLMYSLTNADSLDLRKMAGGAARIVLAIKTSDSYFAFRERFRPGSEIKELHMLIEDRLVFPKSQLKSGTNVVETLCASIAAKLLDRQSIDKSVLWLGLMQDSSQDEFVLYGICETQLKSERLKQEYKQKEGERFVIINGQSIRSLTSNMAKRNTSIHAAVALGLWSDYLQSKSRAERQEVEPTLTRP